MTYSMETSKKSRGYYAQSELVPDCIYNYEPMFICVGKKKLFRCFGPLAPEKTLQQSKTKEIL